MSVVLARRLCGREPPAGMPTGAIQALLLEVGLMLKRDFLQRKRPVTASPQTGR